jgi:hypothetical protein
VEIDAEGEAEGVVGGLEALEDRLGNGLAVDLGEFGAIPGVLAVRVFKFQAFEKFFEFLLIDHG